MVPDVAFAACAAPSSKRMQTCHMLDRELIFIKESSRLPALTGGMDTIQRLGLTVVLALALAFAGGVQALPLVHGLGGEEIVICSDGGIETIMLDRDGNPVGPADSCATCPDCLSVDSVDLPEPGALPVNGEAIAVSARRLPVELPCLSRPHLRPETRGPPPVAHGDAYPNAAVAPPLVAESAWTGERHWNGPCLTEARR